jgi:hypothetical protein
MAVLRIAHLVRKSNGDAAIRRPCQEWRVCGRSHSIPRVAMRHVGPPDATGRVSANWVSQPARGGRQCVARGTETGTHLAGDGNGDASRDGNGDASRIVVQFGEKKGHGTHFGRGEKGRRSAFRDGPQASPCGVRPTRLLHSLPNHGGRRSTLVNAAPTAAARNLLTVSSLCP